jgi:hypothetical protein
LVVLCFHQCLNMRCIVEYPSTFTLLTDPRVFPHAIYNSSDAIYCTTLLTTYEGSAYPCTTSPLPNPDWELAVDIWLREHQHMPCGGLR